MPPLEDHSTHNGVIPVYLSQRPKNVILFGETGVGKSSVINLMAGREMAETSAGIAACTLQTTEYWFGLSEEVSLRTFDTVALDDPDISRNWSMDSIQRAYQLVESLRDAGGINLLLFCIRPGRITYATQRNYRLFYEILRGSQVPLALVVTGLENEITMEDWWVNNRKMLQDCGIHPVAHACITADRGYSNMYAQKWAESQKALRNMLFNTLINPNPSYVRDIGSRLTAIIPLLRSYSAKAAPLKKKDLITQLERRCMFSRNDAEQLAQMLAEGGND